MHPTPPLNLQTPSHHALPPTLSTPSPLRRAGGMPYAIRTGAEGILRERVDLDHAGVGLDEEVEDTLQDVDGLCLAAGETDGVHDPRCLLVRQTCRRAREKQDAMVSERERGKRARNRAPR